MRDREIDSPIADDGDARERALDVRRSFLVQAPAGSGKTELLIQRFLALLACVHRPEQILAMTFTIKAAGEMRQRVVVALRNALEETPCKSANEERTRQLARAALAQDRRHGWRLVDHPARLSMMTIDAFAAGLARRAPLTTRMGKAPRYEEHAEPLYIEAARNALAAAGGDDRAWLRLLAHLDNDADRAVKLVAEMLAKRDQWIGELRHGDRASFREAIETTLMAEIAGQLHTATELFPRRLVNAMVAHQVYAAENLAGDPERAEHGVHLAAIAANGGLPRPAADQLDLWRAIVKWLLVADSAQFRVVLDKRVGFPGKGSGFGAGAREQRNTAMKNLLADLGRVPELAATLDAVRTLPPPRFADEAWMLIEALLDVLPRAAAHLLIVFRDAGAMDFTQGSLAALDALGEEGAPTDLLLKLDLALQHLLVDEFQDTSFAQLALIQRLTAGWQPDDGRTLFVVGDPMQSIYRFRGAEVRLFVDAKINGRVGDVPIETIVLRRNFRSQGALVEWTNRVFPQVLGPISDPWRGLVEFEPASSVVAPLSGLAATAEAFTDSFAEADRIVGHIRTALDDGDKEIAVLVRARAHLVPLLPALRSAGVAFAAVDLDPLSERQGVRDLISLTHALIQPADRLAWLSVLRAPWCGVTLADLFAIVAEADAKVDRSIATLIQSESNSAIPGISADGAARFSRLAQVLASSIAQRGRGSVVARVRGAWLALGGAATLDESADLDGVDQCLALLSAHEVAGDIPDWNGFIDALQTLYAAPEDRKPARVQVMTLHKAKGLEFDTVIIPGLDRLPTGGGNEILLWRRRPRGLLVAPMNAHAGIEDRIYAYLQSLIRAEESAELARLLYVGCTRARRKLHLTGVLEAREAQHGGSEWKSPNSKSAYAKLWEGVRESVSSPAASTLRVQLPAPARPLQRLPLDWRSPSLIESLPHARSAVQAPTTRFDWVETTSRCIGIVAHRLFAQIGREGRSTWNASRIEGSTRRVRAELAQLGVGDSEMTDAMLRVTTAVSRLLSDDRGRWLFDPAHVESASEWALTGSEGNALAQIVLDRSFVADGIRWIVDLKTGTHEGGDVDAFLDREQERYRGQLERYARFVRAIDSRPIRLALYYPMLGGWREWEAGKIGETRTYFAPV